jgi:hypothetical protein
MSLLDLSYIEKDVNNWQSENSPFECKITVSGCKMNSLIDHPYKEALGNFGIPSGLVLVKDVNSNSASESSCITRDMVQHGGAIVPNVIDDSVFDELFSAVSYAKKRNLTRKKRD